MKPTGLAMRLTANSIAPPMLPGSRPSSPAWWKTSVRSIRSSAQALTEDWPLSRLDATLRAILRAGAWELSSKKDVPVAVIVTEYVDVARAFFEEDEPKIVNAVLDRLARKFRAEQTPKQD
jgi:N utilization substance protein B